MKTGIVLGAGVVIGVSLAGISMTKSGYETFINEQSQRLLADVAPGTTISRTILNDGFFTVEDEFVFAFDPTETGLSSDARMQLTVQNSCTIFPFYLSCNDTFSYKASAELEALKQQFLDYNYEAGWNASPLTQNITGWLKGESYTSSSESALTLGKLNLTLDTDFAFSAVGVDFTLDTASMNADSANLRLSDVVMTADLTDIQQNSWIGTNTLTLEDFTANSGDGSEISLEDVLVSSITTEYEEGKYDLNYIVRAQRLSVNQPGLASQADDINFDIRMYGISAEALDLIQDFEQANLTDAAIQKQLIDQLGKSEPGLTLNTLSLTLNEAPINATGELSFEPFTFQDYENMAVASKAHGKVHAMFSGDLETAAPALLPVIQQSVQTGMLTQDENGDFVTDILLEGGAITVNGTVIGQF